MEKKCISCKYFGSTLMERIRCLVCKNHNNYEPTEKRKREDIYATLFAPIAPIKKRLDARIKNVIFNDPATIVFWSDGTKTVVKTQNNEKFDPEKGLAMAIAKKALGNKGNYFNEIKKWVES